MFVAACALFAAAAGAQSQASAPAPQPPLAGASAASQPDATTASYGDWVLQCQRERAQAAGPACELLQTVVAEGQRPIAQLAVARLSSQAPLKLAVILPTHVSFAEAPRLSTAEMRPPAAAAAAGGTATTSVSAAAEASIGLVWRRCLPIGCFADGDLSESVARQWRAQGETTAQTPSSPPAGRLVFQDGSGRPVVLPVSMRGLGEALDALARK